MKVQKNRRNKLVLVSLAVLFIAAYLVVFQKIDPGSRNPSEQNTSILYTSDFLEFSLRVPKTFSIKELDNNITLTSKEDRISINRIATNTSNISDYVALLSKRNNFTLKSQSNGKISNHDYLSGMIDETKIYFIYNNYFVYSLSTSSPELYDDLDQIARSFEYVGE